jgi:hypothetical protein
MRTVAVLLLLLTACVPQAPHYYLHQRQTLLLGSDAALYAGCVRGVIRWHYERTGHFPDYARVEELCAGVQKSFMETWRENGDV